MVNNIFKRSKLNPILGPNFNNIWENKKLYNPGIIFYKGKYHLFYRAVGGNKNWHSTIGYAVSSDGENFLRFDKPILIGQGQSELIGLEDPRLTKINDTFYMVYAAYNGVTPRLSIAVSKDLKKWQKKGPIFKNWNFFKAGGIYTKFNFDGKPVIKQMKTEWSKSGGIFPEKIRGKFLMLFGEHRMWFAESKDGFKWQGKQKPFIEPRSGNYFDNVFVEMGPPPIKTKFGWLVLYHGVNYKHIYQIGFLLLDLVDPTKILYRSDEPIFYPEKYYEMSGVVDVLPGGVKKMEKMSTTKLKQFLNNCFKNNIMPKVVFCCGAVLKNSFLRIYYGAGDSVIGTAVANINDIFKLVKLNK